ncbi:MAG: hypothetical protein K6E98_12080 [Lachnospiraceae bacterium]|nr:hypothetical protein [Lachnospiraceae bacterium]
MKNIIKNTYIKEVIYILIFTVFFISIGKLLRYALNDDTESYTRVTFHEMYEQDNIDVLFLGTSHCMHSYDPALLDKALNLNTFNAASSSQMLDGSLLILKEAAKNNNIKHVYLDLFYNTSYDVHKKRTQMTSAYIITDYLKPSVSKSAYLLKASGKEHYANGFIVARRCWKKLFDPSYVIELLKKKNTPEYKNFGYKYITHENSGYAGKGYIQNKPQVKNWNFFDTWGWLPIAPDTFSEDYKNDLISIIDYCKENNIELTLVSAPTSDFCLTSVGDYDEYISWVRKTAEQNSIEYYDFNLCKEEYFPSSSEMFIDPVHLNQYGADKLADTFAKLANGDVTYNEMFYSNYNEKISSLKPAVFGVSFMNEYDSENNVIRNCRIVTNKSEQLEYKLTLISDNGEESALRDFSSDIYFVLNAADTGKVRIDYRNTEGYEETGGSVLLDIPKS